MGQNKIGDMFEEIDLSHPVVSEEEQKNIDAVRVFLDTNGLGKYYDNFHEFGVRQTKDMIDSKLINDQDLRADIGMSDEHVTLFRKCIDMSAKKSTHLEGGVEEVDVFVTRPGPLGVRLRYHRLIQTPYIALWEDSNHPNPGPLFSAILKLHKEYVIVPEVGDVLVAVNGESVIGLPLEGAVDIIRASAVRGGDRILRFRRTNTYERDHVDGKQSMQPLLSKGDPWRAGLTRYDAFDQALGKVDGVVEDRAVRQLAAGGCPEETGIRGIVWRYLLDQLPEKRCDWAAYLERERNLYIEFSRELFKDKGGASLKAAASSIQSMQNDKMYEPPPKTETEEVKKGEVKKEQVVVESTAVELESEEGKVEVKDEKEEETKETTEETVIEGASVIEEIDIKKEEETVAIETAVERTVETVETGDVGVSDKIARSISDGAVDKVRKRQVEEELDEDEFLLYEISKDVVRTHPDLQFFLDVTHGPARYESIKRVLFVYAKLNPGVKYVQGMNELLGALFYVLAAQSPIESESEEMAEMFHPDTAEADAFNCFTVLMGELRDVFVEDLDDSTTGIKGRMAGIDSLLQHHDVKLHTWLVELGIDPTFYTLRWITTLLSREFDLPDTLRLWDAFLSQAGMRNREIWLAYFCVSMIVGIREELLLADFGGAINALQAYPPTAPSIENLLETATELRKIDAEGCTTGKNMWTWSSRPLSESLMTSERAERWSNAARSSAIAAKASLTGSIGVNMSGLASGSSGSNMMGAARSWWSKRGASDSNVGDSTDSSSLGRSISDISVLSSQDTSSSVKAAVGGGIEPLSASGVGVDSDSDEFEDEDIPLKR